MMFFFCSFSFDENKLEFWGRGGGYDVASLKYPYEIDLIPQGWFKGRFVFFIVRR